MYMSREMFNRYVGNVRKTCKENNFNLRLYYKKEGFYKQRYFVNAEIDYMFDYDTISDININVGICFWLKDKLGLKKED